MRKLIYVLVSSAFTAVCSANPIDISLPDGWVRSPLGTFENIWQSQKEPSLKKIIIIRRYQNNSQTHLQEKDLANRIRDALGDLEGDRRQIYSTFGITNWTIQEKEVSTKLFPGKVSATIMGNYLNQKEKQRTFVELFIYDKNYTLHISHFTEEQRSSSTNDVVPFLKEIAFKLINNRKPASKNSEVAINSTTEAAVCNCDDNNLGAKGETKKDLNKIPLDELCKDVPEDDRIKPE